MGAEAPLSTVSKVLTPRDVRVSGKSPVWYVRAPSPAAPVEPSGEGVRGAVSPAQVSEGHTEALEGSRAIRQVL